MSNYRHTDECTGESIEPPTLGTRGDAWLYRCMSCGATTVIPIAAGAPTDKPPVELRTNYRCRTHHDVTVTFRGTGCLQCEAEHPKPQTKRRPYEYDYEINSRH